jgi:hypothetical protein
MDRITHQSPRQRGYGSYSSIRNNSLKHTRKHERKEGGIEPRNKAARHWRTVRPGGADCPHCPRGQSGQVPQTVCKCHQNHQRRTGKTDCPRGPGGPSAPDPDRPLLKLGPSANRLQQKPNTKADQNKNTKNTTMNWAELVPRGRSAERGGLSASSNRAEKARAREVNSTNSSPDLPNGSDS